jgi:hypothetical protein
MNVWKGEMMKDFTVTTARQSAMCGYNFEVGKKYLVYANQSGDGLMVNNCSRTTVFNDDGDAKYLKKFLKDPDQTEAVLITQFTYSNKEVLLLELDNYVNSLQNAPTARGYIIIKGNKKSRSDATKQIRKHIKNRGMDSKRVVFLNGKGDSKAMIELWLVPPGAQPPTAKKISDKKESVETQIIALEKQAWAEWKNGNKKFVENYLADDAFFVNAEGVINKAQIVAAVGSCQFNDYSLEGFAVKILDKNAVLVNYTANQDIVCNGEAAPKAVRSTTVYVKRKGKWLSTFYTEIPIVQKTSDKPMEAKAREDLIEELKGIVARFTPDKNEAKTVAKKWDQRKDLTGKTKKEVIDLLYEDVKNVIKDSGIQYLIFSTFSFYKNIPE